MNLKINPGLILSFVMLLLGLVLFQKQLILDDPLLNFDDSYVVKNLESLQLSSISDYINHVKNKRITDIQPVRDFSLKLDYVIGGWIGKSIHHLMNTLIWFLCCCLFYLLLKQNEFSNKLSFAMCSLFAFHPAISNALFWVTARKHLLSSMFTLAATVLLIKALQSKRNAYIAPMILCYFLACFSQVINVGWPLGAFFIILAYENSSIKEFFKNKTWMLTFSVLAMIAIGSVWINLTYYSSGYARSEAANVVPFSINILGLKVLSLGRSFLQALIPIIPTPTPYNLWNPINSVGLILLLIGCGFLYKFHTKKNLAWAIFGLTPILVTLARPTTVYCSDTYLQMMVIGLYVVIAFQLSRFEFKKHIPYISLILILFVFLFHKTAKAWRSDTELFIFATKQDATPLNLKILSYNLIRDKDYARAFEATSKLIEIDPYAQEADLLFSKSVLGLTQSPGERIEKLKMGLGYNPESSWIRYFLAGTYASVGKINDAFEVTSKLRDVDFYDYRNEVSVVAAECLFFCLKSQGNCEETRQKIDKVKILTASEWNETNYLKRMKELGI